MSNAAQAQPAAAPATFTVSVREARLVVSRILLTCGLEPGYVPAVTETVLLSQAQGGGGFRRLAEDMGGLDLEPLARLEMREMSGDELELDAAGLHAWLLAPTLIDIAVDLARQRGGAVLRVAGVARPEELVVLEAWARRYGARVQVAPEDGRWRVSAVNSPMPANERQWDPLLHAALRDGYVVPAELWRELYARSNRALAPDSVQSRRHAGPVIMLDDGTVAGRIPEDDDFDPRMLLEVAASPKS